MDQGARRVKPQRVGDLAKEPAVGLFRTKCFPHVSNISHRARNRNAAPPRPLVGAGGWGVRVVTARIEDLAKDPAIGLFRTKCFPHVSTISHRARNRNAAPPRAGRSRGVRVVTARIGDLAKEPAIGLFRTKCFPHVSNISHRARNRNAAPPRPLAGAGGWGVRVVTAREAAAASWRSVGLRARTYR